MDMHSFDMIAAVTQDTINFQFSQLFKQGVLPKSWELSHDGIVLKAELAAPTVNFGTPDSRRAALFFVNIKSGSFQYWKGFGRDAVLSEPIPIKNWVYAFRVNLDFADIQKSYVQQSKAVPELVKKHLEQFSANQMSIRHLFMDFQNANIATYDPDRTSLLHPNGQRIDDGALRQFQTTLSNYFTGLRGADNPYILGYALETRDRESPRVATFVPASCLFSTFIDPKVEGLNTLNFLMSTDPKKRPVDPQKGLFAHNLVTSSEYDGKFLMSRELFWDQWFVPKLKSIFEIDREQTGGFKTKHDGKYADYDYDNGDYQLSHSAESKHLSMKYEFAKRHSFMHPNLVGTKVPSYDKTCTNLDTNVYYRKEPGKLVLDLRVRMGFSYTLYLPDAHEDRDNFLASVMGRVVTADWRGELELVTANGNVALRFASHALENRRTQDNDNFTGWMLDNDFLSRNRTQMDEAGKRLDAMVDRLEKRLLELPMPNHYLILPAGDVFFFKNLALDPDSNVAMDISYKG